MKIIPEECIISHNGFTCFKKASDSFLNKILTNDYIIGYICFRGCEFVIKVFLDNKHHLLSIVNGNNYSHLFN